MNKNKDLKILFKYYEILCETLFEEFDDIFYKKQYINLSKLYFKLCDKMEFKHFKHSLYINIMYKEEKQEIPTIEDRYFFSVYKQTKLANTYHNIIVNYYKKINNEI